MKLGIVYKNGKVINHRSFVKVVFNPIFRYFGFCIATKFKKNEIVGLRFIKCENQKIRWEKYRTDYDFILKSRMIL